MFQRILLILISIYVFFNLIAISQVNAKVGDQLIAGELEEVKSGDTLVLQQGYALTATIAGDMVIFSLSKNGIEVKRESLTPNQRFDYFKQIDLKNYQIISISSFRVESGKVKLRIYQYSEGSPVNAKVGDQLIAGELEEVKSGDTLVLQQGYALTATIAGDMVIFSLSKNGIEVKRESLTPNQRFDYFKQIDLKNYQIISISSFRVESGKVKLRIYQYSDGSALLPTPTPSLIPTPAQTTKSTITTPKPSPTPSLTPTPKPTTITPTPELPPITTPSMEKPYRILALMPIIFLLFQYIKRFNKK